MPWRLDADLHVITLDRENDDLDLIADPDALLSFPAQYEHSSFLNGRGFSRPMDGGSGTGAEQRVTQRVAGIAQDYLLANPALAVHDDRSKQVDRGQARIADDGHNRPDIGIIRVLELELVGIIAADLGRVIRLDHRRGNHHERERRILERLQPGTRCEALVGDDRELAEMLHPDQTLLKRHDIRVRDVKTLGLPEPHNLKVPACPRSCLARL